MVLALVPFGSTRFRMVAGRSTLQLLTASCYIHLGIPFYSTCFACTSLVPQNMQQRFACNFEQNPQGLLDSETRHFEQKRLRGYCFSLVPTSQHTAARMPSQQPTANPQLISKRENYSRSEQTWNGFSYTEMRF